MQVRPLNADDARQFQAVRLQGLRDVPTAFASSFEEEEAKPLAAVAKALAADDNGAVFGAFDDSTLVGITGVRREMHHKLAHKAIVWGVFVVPGYRNRGIGRRLVAEALEYAFSTLEIRQVNLVVNTSNRAAIALYESMGFRTFGVEEGFLAVNGVLYDELHMVCVRAQP